MGLSSGFGRRIITLPYFIKPYQMKHCKTDGLTLIHCIFKRKTYGCGRERTEYCFYA
jgi:hypothetical protein